VRPEPLKQIKNILAVSSCKGGVGKSTIAAHLARYIHSLGFKTGLLDADIHGPSIPTLLDIPHPKVQMIGKEIWPHLLEKDFKVLSFGFLLGDGAAVLRGPMVASYVQQILLHTQWGELDTLVIDLPPGTGDAQITITQHANLDGAIIVTTPQALSLVDVSKGIVMFEKVNVPVLGLVENMNVFECGGCHLKHYPFGKGIESLKERFGLETLSEFPILPEMSDIQKFDLQKMKPLYENVQRQLEKNRSQKDPLPVVDYSESHIRIHWPENKVTLLKNTRVRAACRCAQCVDENTGQPKLNPETIPINIRAETIARIGNYALSIVWSDGHTMGIFPYKQLKELGN
jgi:Mrp family chromosome partitioning ATPase/DUF971 family protein